MGGSTRVTWDAVYLRITHTEPGTNTEVVGYDNVEVRASGNDGAGKRMASGAEGDAITEGRISLGTN